MPDVEFFKSTDADEQYILESVMILKDNGFARALFMRRKRYSDRNMIGSRHSNPLLDMKFNFRMD